MTDLSILFPLPETSAELGGLIAASDQGASGVVLPTAVFDQMPQLSFSFNDKPSEYAGLRAVSARLDPCFDIAGQCNPQLRLVFQPIAQGDGEPVAADAAVHVFYSLSDAEFTGLLGAMTRAQSAEDASGPLTVHPAMAREGLAGPAAQSIKEAMLVFAGEERLVRATFMQLGGQGNVWEFGGFEIAAGTLTPLAIAGGAEVSQRFENNAFHDLPNFYGAVVPVIPPDDFSVFYESDTAGTMTDDDLRDAYTSALRTENPTLHSADSVACVQCHTANAAIDWADRSTDLELEAISARFTSDHDLTQPSTIFADRTMTVRAFGYQDRVVAVSRRTIFETATVVDATREKYGFGR
ncbi:MAG: hypothetical protein HOV80_36945 [Polyangiaceae bacterium]|nr:hypothetical protein [Polyangiaceae bacterium]